MDSMQFQIKIINRMFCRNMKSNVKIDLEIHTTLNSQKNSEKGTGADMGSLRRKCYLQLLGPPKWDLHQWMHTG